ncbi:MAG: hypothetical protein ABIJ56_03435 [Pseudomonadota bacterium]
MTGSIRKMNRETGHGHVDERNAVLLFLVTCTALSVMACGTGGSATPVSVDRKVLFRVTVENAAISDLAMVGSFPDAALHSNGRLHGEGELIVSLEDMRGNRLFAGSTLDPRRGAWDEFSGGSIRGGGSLTLDRAEGFVSVPEPLSGTGTIELQLSSPLGPVAPGAFTFNTSTGQTQTAVFQLTEGELTFLEGNRDPADSFIVLFVANGFGDDLEPFNAMAQSISREFLRLGWFDIHREGLSLWTMADSEANSDTSIVCGENTIPELMLAAERASELHGKVLPRATGREYGAAVASPDIIVFITNQVCRAFAGTFILLGNTDTEPWVLAHELGHSIGNLDDEYPEEDRGCPGWINTTPMSDIRWKCLLSPLPTAASCPDGSALGAYPPVLSCDDWGHPCRHCLMLDVTSDFCTVCRNRMDLVMTVRMNHLVYADVSEACNGIDDNMDGSVDEGCPCCIPGPELCGDGVDNNCDGTADEGCAACGDALCEPGAGETCATCPDDCGACPPACPDGVCEPGAGESCASCPADCGECPPACPNGLCEPALGETCSTCPADCGECPWCGDGICNGTEACSSCEADCGPCTWCGDGTCNGGETCSSCATDCGTCGLCGDGTCNYGETCSTCPSDCGACEVCGDSRCLGPENCSSCATDCCPVCGNGLCDAPEFCFTCPADCGVCSSGCGDGVCDGSEYCYECAMDCCPECGYGTCDPLESCSTCQTDCCPVCGNGTCEIAESCTFCPRDCGDCG